MKQLKPFQKLWDLIAEYKQEIGAIYFYSILSGLVQLTVPIGVQAIIGFVLGASMVTSIYILILLVVLGVMVVGLMQINQMKIIEKIQQKIFINNSIQFAEIIPRVNINKTDRYYLPELTNRFFDTLIIQKGLSKVLLDVPLATIQILFGLILLSLYHPVFIVFGLLLLSLLWIILKYTGKNGIATSIEESTYKYAVVAWLEEMARIIKSFKFSQGTELNIRNTDKNLSGYIKARTAHFNVLLIQYKSLVAFKVLITTAMLLVGAVLLLNQQLNIGEFIAAEIVILTVISAVEKLIARLDSVYDIVTGLEKIAKVTEKEIEVDGTLEIEAPNGIEIKMNELSFAYPDGKKVLQNNNIIIPAGAKVIIDANDGSGKSTLLKIVSTVYRDYSGVLLFNNIPVSNYSLASLRKNIGLFINENELFTGTVYENICMGRKDISSTNIIQLAAQVGIDKFIEQLPEGFNTMVDAGGKKLSNSVKYSILMLRALTANPQLLILDEPWKNFDERVQEKLVQYLTSSNNKATVIMTGHNKYMNKNASQILHLVNGKLTSNG